MPPKNTFPCFFLFAAVAFIPRAYAEEGAHAVRVRSESPAPLSFQYGVALTSLFVVDPGPMCEGGFGCVLGSGGGLSMRLGVRRSAAWYFGVVAELSKQDPDKLYRLAILKQARAEARHYLNTALDTKPFATLGLGLAGYGSEADLDAWGPSSALGMGIETEVVGGPLLGITASYRTIYFGRFEHAPGGSHAPGIAHLVGIDLTIEASEGR